MRKYNEDSKNKQPKKQPDKNKSDNKNNKDKKDKNEKKPGTPPDKKIDFQLDPFKVKPKATEGKAKTKKEKVFHVDKSKKSGGDFVDPEKLIPQIIKEKNIGNNPVLSELEKKLIEAYRKKLKKFISSD